MPHVVFLAKREFESSFFFVSIIVHLGVEEPHVAQSVQYGLLIDVSILGNHVGLATSLLPQPIKPSLCTRIVPIPCPDRAGKRQALLPTL